MRRRFNMAVVVALVIASVAYGPPAHAGAVLDGSNDRVDIGTMGSLGSSIKGSAGWSLMCWVKTSQTSVSSMIGNFTQGYEGAVGAANQSLMYDIQTKWTTDFASNANSTLLDMGDENDNGLLWWHTLTGITIGDGAIHHHAITVIATGNDGANNNSGATLTSYQDGVASGVAWTKPYSDGLGTVRNFAVSLAIGAEGKNGGTFFDWTAGTFADCRVYLRALSAAEISDIYKLNGRDTVYANLERRWPLQGACVERQKNDTCTLTNGPTLSTVHELAGIRRR